MAILAGGASRRMGVDKATAQLVDGVTVLEWLRDRVAELFDDVFVVANEPARFRRFGLPVVTDALTERGSVVGIYTAVLASPTERVLCLACDMPFVTGELLEALVDGSPGFDVYVPLQGDYFEPLCAVYSISTADTFERFLEAGGRRIYDVYGEVRTGYLDVSDGRFGDPEEVFLNTNTPEDLERARVRARASVRQEATALASTRPPTGGADGGSGGGVVSDLSAGIQAFIARAPFPVVSFVGKKKSGKTTVLEGVVRELSGRGWRVAVVKHDSHGFDPDVPGTDSYRLRHAGAVVTGITGPGLYMWITRTETEPPLTELMDHLTVPVDLLITEGFKLQQAPKVEVSRRERSTSLVCTSEELVGIVSDQHFADHPVPQLSMDDPRAIADLIERRVMPLWAGRHRAGDVAAARWGAAAAGWSAGAGGAGTGDSHRAGRSEGA